MFAPDNTVARELRIMNIKSPSINACMVRRKLPAVYNSKNSDLVVTFLARKFLTVSGSQAINMSNIPTNP